ncbi:MAG: Ig-like domain-containing protein, partial [Acidobacteriota bacterium]
MLAVFETVFFPGATGDLSGGFLFGETYDDTTGRPLAAASARLYPVGVGLPGAVADAAAGAPLFSVSTEGRGRYTLVTASPSQVPAGRYALLLSKDGFTSVVRHLALEPTRGLVPLDARLTPLALAAGSLDPIAGGSATADGLGLDADPAALPGTDALDVTLTRLSGQGLPDVLPLGWTPAGVVDVRLDGAGGVVPQADAFAGSVRVTLPLDAWVLPGDALIAAQYDLASGTWKALGLPQVDAGIATVEIPATGAVAVLRADTDPAIAPPSPSTVGEALQGVERPTSTPDFDADLVLDPPVIPPTGRSRARVVARSADGSTVWPSGLAVQAFLEERLVLAAGQGQLLEAPFSADLLLYQPRLTPAERGGVADGAAGALDFVVSPSPRAAQVLLDVGFESIRLYGFPDLVDRGSQVGPTGGTVGDPDGVELEIPEGALTGETVATAELLDADALAELPAVEGFDTVAAVRIDLQGRALGRAATVRLPAPDGLPAALAGDPRLILATFVEAPGDFRGDFARLVARVARQGSGASTRLVAGPAVDGGLLLDGLRGEGTYLVLWARAPIGFATGRVLGVGASALVDARVVTDGLGTADQSREGGRYLVPVVAGAAPSDPANLHALHPSTDERGSATASVAAGQSVDIDLQLARTPPRVLDFQPADGATDQPTLLTPTIQWSEALDPSSVAEGQMQVELADADFRGTGLFVSGTVELSPDGTRLSFASDRPLPPGRRYVARFNGGVRDLDGTPYDGPLPLVRRFTTSTVVAPGGQVKADRFHVELPTDGVVRVWADPGAVPLAQAGQADWSISPYIVGPRPGLDPVRDTYPARADGSFEASVGRPPEFPVTFDSEVWVVVLDPSGQKAAEFRLGPFTTPDGKGFVAPAGEAITFRSAEGITVDVPAGAFDQGTLVTVSIQDPPPAAAVALAGQLGLGPAVALDFEGTAKETLRLSLPAPADAVLGKQVFFGEILNVAWGERLRMTSYGEVADLGGQRVLTNRPEYQAEPDPALLDAVRSEGAPTDAFATTPETRASTKMDDEPPKTCADIKSRGLGRCFAQDLLIEMLQASLTVSFYELGVDYALLTGPAAVLPLSWGAGMEILAEKIFDQWVFLPKPMDSRAGFWILPVPVDEPLTMVRRDAATGWVIGEQAYDPIPGDGASAGVAVVDPLLGVPPAPPMLVGVEPFDFVRFAAPPKDTESRLRLEIEVQTDGHDRSRLDGVAPYDLPDHTGLQVFDLEPLQPKPDPDDPDAPAEPKPPIAGPRLVVCDNGTTWSTSTFEATDDLLAIVSPGDLDPEDLEIITLEFDRAIDSELEDKEPDAVAVLTDLGPYDGCQVGGTGYPRTVQLEPRVVGDGRSVALIAASTLSSGHRFRLTLVPSA